MWDKTASEPPQITRKQASGRRKLVIVASREATASEPTPKLYRMYCAYGKLPQLEWIIEGTDSNLYVVPAEPGGWMRRSEYQGEIEKLKVVSQKKARAICWTMYGDVGRVTIEGANVDPDWPRPEVG